MKGLFTPVVALIFLSVFAFSTARGAFAVKCFVRVTLKYDYPDIPGLSSHPGEIEMAVDEDDDNYILWFSDDRRLRLPKRCAAVISDRDAAVNLIAVRQKLYTLLDQAQKPANPREKEENVKKK